jgi:phage FluMu gp28-like protein
MTLIRVRRTESELGWCASEHAFAESFLRHGGQPLRLEPYQRAFLRDRSKYRWVIKARQVGYSFLFAAEALVRCHTHRNFTAILVSYNLQDAVEKIKVARDLYEEMDGPFRKRLVNDSKTELVFESLSSGRRGRSRIVSVPSKAPRGKHGTVYLDELAHYQDAKGVYSGTTATIMRSGGQLTAASTPLGRRGVFWEVASRDGGRFGHYSRQFVPWWACGFFANDPRSAVVHAPTLSTEERVRRFGTSVLRAQLESLERLQFQQELECSFISERGSFYPYDLVLGCMSDDVVLAEDWTDVPKPEGRLVAGFDVGRMRDRSELALFEQRDDRLVCRALRTFDQMPFASQEAELRRLLDVLPIARLSLDAGGIGMHLAENLCRDYPQVVPETFSTESKERWATDLKIALQRKDVDLPLDRELLAQIHSVERRQNASGRLSFDAPSGAQGHADRFWAIALACQKERAERERTSDVRIRVIDPGGTRSDQQSLFPDVDRFGTAEQPVAIVERTSRTPSVVRPRESAAGVSSWLRQHPARPDSS